MYTGTRKSATGLIALLVISPFPQKPVEKPLKCYPPLGLELPKEIDASVTLQLAERKVYVKGEKWECREQPTGLPYAYGGYWRAGFLDTYLAVSSGTLEDLERRFTHFWLASSGEGDEQWPTDQRDFDVKDDVCRYTKTGSGFKATVESTGFDEILFCVPAGMDFEWLIPARSGTRSQEWSIDPRDFVMEIVALWRPLTATVKKPNSEETSAIWPRFHAAPVPMLMNLLGSDSFLPKSDVSGRCRARKTATEGISLAAIDVNFDIDVLSNCVAWLTASDDPTNGCIKYSVTEVRVSATGCGTLYWESMRNSCASFVLESDIECHMKVGWSYDWETPRIETITGTLDEEWQGNMRFELSVPSK